MVYYLLFIILNTFEVLLFHISKALKDILQHFKPDFKFVNWRIHGFIFLMSLTGLNSPFNDLIWLNTFMNNKN